MKPGNRLYCRKVLIPAEDVSSSFWKIRDPEMSI